MARQLVHLKPKVYVIKAEPDLITQQQSRIIRVTDCKRSATPIDLDEDIDIGKPYVPSQLKNSDGEHSDSGDSHLNMYEEKPVRKRERLTHLTPEEKQWRRKMKNRQAAQAARDRKKAYTDDIEVRLRRLEQQNAKLHQENMALKARNEQLETMMQEKSLALESAEGSGSRPLHASHYSPNHPQFDADEQELQAILDDLLRGAPNDDVEGISPPHATSSIASPTSRAESHSCHNDEKQQRLQDEDIFEQLIDECNTIVEQTPSVCSHESSPISQQTPQFSPDISRNSILLDSDLIDGRIYNDPPSNDLQCETPNSNQSWDIFDLLQ